MKKLELRLHAKLGGHTIEQFIEQLKKDRDMIDVEKGHVLTLSMHKASKAKHAKP